MLARFLIALTCASTLLLLSAQAQAQSSLPGLFGLSRPSAGCVFPDAGTFSAGATCGVPAQGMYQTTATANPLVSGQAGALQATINRALHINVRNSTGVEVLPSTSTLQATNSATTAHTCSVAGFSELGCLGQIDDDIKSPLALGTTAGWTPKLITSLTNSAQAVKASGGWLGTIQCDNNNAAWTYVQIYNIASGSVTVGTSTPLYVLPLAPSLSNGMVMNAIGLQFGTAISVAATTTATGGSAPGTNSLTCSFAYN